LTTIEKKDFRDFFKSGRGEFTTYKTGIPGSPVANPIDHDRY